MISRGVRRELAGLLGLGAAVLFSGRRRKSALAFGTAAAALELWPSPKIPLRDRRVIITGGSRGLGLALAEALLLEGAQVALLARDAQELLEAQVLLMARTQRLALAVPCDLRDVAAYQRVLGQTAEILGGVDLLINNAGAMVVGPFEQTTAEDYAMLSDLHVQAVAAGVRALLPSLRASSHGHIVNIASIGGKIPMPHLSAYCAAKFGLAGLSAVLEAELAADQIGVTTVFPGLMRTGSAIHAEMRGNAEEEYAWFAASSVAPGVAISPARAARKILAGVCRGDREVTFPANAKLAVFLDRHFPELSASARKWAAGLLPLPEAGPRKSGADSQGLFEQDRWLRPARVLSERAQHRWNE